MRCFFWESCITKCYLAAFRGNCLHPLQKNCFAAHHLGIGLAKAAQCEEPATRRRTVRFIKISAFPPPGGPHSGAVNTSQMELHSALPWRPSTDRSGYAARFTLPQLDLDTEFTESRWLDSIQSWWGWQSLQTLKTFQFGYSTSQWAENRSVYAEKP